MNKITRYSPSVRQEALQMYMVGNSLPAIAQELSVPYGTVHNWHSTEHWADMRRQIRTDLLNNWNDYFKAKSIVAMHALVIDHLKIGATFADRIKESLARPDVSPEELRNLAQALSAEFRVVEKILAPIIKDKRAIEPRGQRTPIHKSSCEPSLDSG